MNVTLPLENREQGIAQVLRQLSADHQNGRLSMSAYRRLRRELLDRAVRGEDIISLPTDQVSADARPGIMVWAAVVVIVLLLVAVGWLLR